MKKSNLTISFEDEKLKALRLFAGKKDADLDGELAEAVQKLYEKYVPKDARELVELMGSGADAKVKMAKKPAASKQANMGNAGGSSTAVESGSTMTPRP